VEGCGKRLGACAGWPALRKNWGRSRLSPNFSSRIWAANFVALIFVQSYCECGIVHLANKKRMSDKSKIEWTDATWNPVRGCTKISPGCKHCYAEVFAERFRGVRGHPYEQGFDLRLVPEKLEEPLRWKTPRLIFVNSMSDLFQVGVPDEYIAKVAAVMHTATWHTFQVLTKRAERMRSLLNTKLQFAAHSSHIWWGVSVEDQKHGMPRIAELRNANVAMRFLSVEPLLEDVGLLNLSGIHWVIVGGESGPGARPMHKEWVLSIKKQCRENGVPFFFKQWGGVRKAKNGRELNGRTYDQMPRLSVAARFGT
jgi:protein gp37